MILFFLTERRYQLDKHYLQMKIKKLSNIRNATDEVTLARVLNNAEFNILFFMEEKGLFNVTYLRSRLIQIYLFFFICIFM